jgi:hypothetical protein
MFPVISAAAMIVAGSAVAGVNIEYGQEYEEAYLLVCERENSPRACSCSMEALEQKVGFTRFAEEIDRYREEFLERSPLATLATDFVNACSAIGQLKE